MATLLLNGALELAHLLSHQGITDHTLSTHAHHHRHPHSHAHDHDSRKIDHKHNFLSKFYLFDDWCLSEHPFPLSLSDNEKHHRIRHSITEDELKPQAEAPFPDKSNYEKIVLSFPYIRTFIDPPDLG
ncbi:MAG: hypothetical protein AAF433_07585 [Bacteroidota bacterium]